VRAVWPIKTVAEAITEALATTLEALGRQVGSLSMIERQTQFTFLKKRNHRIRELETALPTNKSEKVLHDQFKANTR